MNDLSEKIAADFGRKMARQMQAQLQREVALVQSLLEPADLIMMLSKLAAGISNAAIMVGLQVRKEEADPDALYELLLESIHRLTAIGKPEILELIAAIDAKETRTPAQTEMLVKRGAL
ncbi:hypothetical protein CA223_05305 [Sphingomonas koreensis]|uniref:Uncharacterized protein n=1 Tax=Sphingomonas koreensis TaxID=93064 RepID=A0A1L6JBS3_9SPHN|nr:hypothetical protein [Sphingomonas koreensis]APR53333.1 hypothetical protein BRX40_13660 [Sphingomonas koreensis]MDC7809977.1 hypothetical protein [Sphingomonas koreensis]RSU24547.1 hypothetical protein CA224_02175 [Sphingomonas koreensis]RSU25192.1 hypothetical protein CA222_13770 [Sphingomonas koreensis]RSU30133.1 hypothetical protein CA225_05580 [Sphingomonas koreensis]